MDHKIFRQGHHPRPECYTYAWAEGFFRLGYRHGDNPEASKIFELQRPMDIDQLRRDVHTWLQEVHLRVCGEPPLDLGWDVL